MLSLIRIGIPCSGPRVPLSLRSLSRLSAIASASGFISITLLTAGPCLSIASIRDRYFSAIDRAVNLPENIPAWRSEIVISSSSKDGKSGAEICAGSSRAPAKAGNNAACSPLKKLFRQKLFSGRVGLFFLISGKFICIPFPDAGEAHYRGWENETTAN